MASSAIGKDSTRTADGDAFFQQVIAGLRKQYELARIQTEHYRSLTSELDYKVAVGEVVSRDAVRKASSRIFAQTAQAMRSIPDRLERRMGIDPETAEQIADVIDNEMHKLAQHLEAYVKACTST